MRTSQVNRSFGATRRPSAVVDVAGTAQGDEYAGGYGSYAMASGITQANLEQARAELKTLQEERITLNDAVGKAQAAINANNEKYAAGGRGWNDCKSSDCKSIHTAKRCGGCRDPFNQMMISSVAARTNLNATKATAVGNLAAKDTQISAVGETIAGLIASVTAENQAELELAGQGLTSEAIQIEAEGKAQAEVEESRILAETAAGGKKTRNMIIALVAVAIVAVGVIFMIKKIKSKKKGKK